MAFILSRPQCVNTAGWQDSMALPLRVSVFSHRHFTKVMPSLSWPKQIWIMETYSSLLLAGPSRCLEGIYHNRLLNGRCSRLKLQLPQNVPLTGAVNPTQAINRTQSLKPPLRLYRTLSLRYAREIYVWQIIGLWSLIDSSLVYNRVINWKVRMVYIHTVIIIKLLIDIDIDETWQKLVVAIALFSK